jgi:two-component system, cell cycle response regulator
MSDSSHHLRRRRPSSVLIADDHDHSRSAARLVLEDAGFGVIEARTGFDALVLAQISRPCVSLLDIVLPEIDGLQLTRMFRADPAMRDSAIIAITAHSVHEYRDAAIEAGCDEFMTKPVGAPHLVELVRLYARRRSRPAYEHHPASPSDTSPAPFMAPRVS